MTAKTKQTPTDTEARLLKEIKRLKALNTDLNKEIHSINKWRKAVEDKIGAVNYED